MTGTLRPAEFDTDLVAHRGSLLAFARSLVQDRDRAEDLVSETIVKAMTSYHLFQEGTNLRSWLFTILRNHLFSQHRKSGREVPDPDGLIAGSVPVEEGQTAAFDLKVVRKRMRMLSPDQRKMVELVAVLGYEYEEAAEQLGVPIGTVKSGLFRARHYLETGEDVADPVEEVAEATSPVVVSDRIAALYREGLSVSEIKGAIEGISRSEIMQVILDRKLSAKRA